MADIWSVLRGQPGYDAMCAMSIPDLMNWHRLAAERAPKKDR